MPPQTQNTPELARELAGDLRPLLEQLGSPADLADLADAAPFADGPILTVAGLRNFLRQYCDRMLLPLELPAINRAFGHARRGEVRELVAFDQELGAEPVFRSLASASRRVGQRQLLRLRPLRDDRTVQRYLAAVDAGSAQGWHTLVYGLTLAVYSLPLRQGLLGYAEQTTRGFIQSAGRKLALSKAEARELREEIFGSIPQTVETLVNQTAVVLT
jgi:urease accessory protein UreF